MFQTVMSNPLLTVQGDCVIMAQIHTKTLEKRYVILDSDTLKPLAVCATKEDLEKHTQRITDEKSSPKSASLEDLFQTKDSDNSDSKD